MNPDTEEQLFPRDRVGKRHKMSYFLHFAGGLHWRWGENSTLLCCYFAAQDNASIRHSEEERTEGLGGVGWEAVLHEASWIICSELWGGGRRGRTGSRILSVDRHVAFPSASTTTPPRSIITKAAEGWTAAKSRCLSTRWKSGVFAGFSCLRSYLKVAIWDTSQDRDFAFPGC